MRIYSTSSASVTTVRKAGYYPSHVVARRLAVRLAYVLGDENHPHIIEAITDALEYGHPFTDLGQWAAAMYKTVDGVTRDVTEQDEFPTDSRWWSRKQAHQFYGRRLILVRELSPAEQRAIEELSDWWTADDGPLLEQKCFIAANLNNGRTLVVVDRQR